jgi:hypothetical protein
MRWVLSSYKHPVIQILVSKLLEDFPRIFKVGILIVVHFQLELSYQEKCFFQVEKIHQILVA